MKWDYRFIIGVRPSVDDDFLKFVSQLGISDIRLTLPNERAAHTPEYLKEFQARLAGFGLRLHHVLSQELSKNPAVILNLDNRADVIARWKEFLPVLAEAGVNRVVFTFEQNAVYTTHRDAESRGCKARFVDAAELAARPLTHGREFTAGEIWDNFTYFMQEIMPVAGQCGVRLLLHPNDPPMEKLGGVPTLINSFDSYKRAFETADSFSRGSLGMEFCCGCWLEGGGFTDVLGSLRWCLEQKRVEVVHFRNVSAPLPVFKETFLDNGYMDMYKIMRVLCEMQYGGVITLDHTPEMAGDPQNKAAFAYAIGYMRALAERAMDEK